MNIMYVYITNSCHSNIQKQQKISNVYHRHCTMSFTLIKLSFRLQLFSTPLNVPRVLWYKFMQQGSCNEGRFVSSTFKCFFLFTRMPMFLQHWQHDNYFNRICIICLHETYKFALFPFKPQGLLKHELSFLT